MNVSRKGLHLDFDRLAQAGIMDPITSVTRASSGTVIAADGTIATVAANLPRYTKVGNKRGLLIEEQRTNYAYMNPVFAPGTLTTVNGPDGTATARRIVATSTDRVINDFSNGPTAAGSYSLSVWVRCVSGSNSVSMMVGDQSGGQNIALTGTLSVGSSWQRISATGVKGTGIALGRISLNVQNGATIEFWGFQLEAGPFPTSYIPTSGAAATRSFDDVASIKLSDAKVGLLTQSGTYVVDITLHPGANGGGSANGFHNEFYFGIKPAGESVWSAGGFLLWKYEMASNTSVALGNTTDWTNAGGWSGGSAGGRQRWVFSIVNGLWHIAKNGTILVQDYAYPANMPKLEDIIIGKDGAGGNNRAAGVVYHEIKYIPASFPSTIVKALSDTNQYPL